MTKPDDADEPIPTIIRLRRVPGGKGRINLVAITFFRGVAVEENHVGARHGRGSWASWSTWARTSGPREGGEGDAIRFKRVAELAPWGRSFKPRRAA